MTNEQKQKMVEYLYPTDQILDFMCNDVYQELLNVIPTNLIIHTNNLVHSVRENNFKLVKENVFKFIILNKNYKAELFNLYKHSMLAPIVHNIIIGLTFYIVNTNEKYHNIDIFKNKKSICYQKVSILDFI